MIGRWRGVVVSVEMFAGAVGEEYEGGYCGGSLRKGGCRVVNINGQSPLLSSCAEAMVFWWKLGNVTESRGDGGIVGRPARNLRSAFTMFQVNLEAPLKRQARLPRIGRTENDLQKEDSSNPPFPQPMQLHASSRNDGVVDMSSGSNHNGKKKIVTFMLLLFVPDSFLTALATQSMGSRATRQGFHVASFAVSRPPRLSAAFSLQ